MIATSRTWEMYGLKTLVSTDEPALLDAIQQRLRRFAPNGHKDADLKFEFTAVAEAGRHPFERPPGPARPVYQPVLGEATYADVSDRLYINYGDLVRVLCEPDLGLTRISFLRAEAHRIWLLSHPLFTLPLVEMLKRKGYYSLHAAGLSVDGKAILFPGGTGSGKSTLALALLREGMGFLGDDMLFLRGHGETLQVAGFPDEIDITPQTAKLFPELRDFGERQPRPGWKKHQVVPETFPLANIVPTAAPVALVFPRVAGKDSSVLTAMNRDEALVELAANVLLTDAQSSQAHLDALAQLVRQSRCYRLETGRDFGALRQILEGLVH
jgi:hypothetical protein